MLLRVRVALKIGSRLDRSGDLQNFGYFIPDELQGHEDEGMPPILFWGDHFTTFY